MALDLGELLKQRDVPKMGPQQERIEYIHIDKLVSDERNFYELSGIDDLAENIGLVGLMDPIRVREIKSSGGHYRIVSGHRRKTAIKKLVEGGRKDLENVPCIVEIVECSKAMQELRLIWANKDTREMTSPEKARQAEKAREVLLQLKEEGFVFEGRLRDHVAQLVGESKSKLSRLKVIREKLHPTFLAGWESGEINDSVAYRIAQEDERVQNQLFSNTGYAARHWTVDAADAAINRVKNPPVSKTVNFGNLNAQKMANDYLEERAKENHWFFEHMRNHIFDMMIGGFTVIPSRQDGIQYLKDYHSNGGFWGAVRFERSKTGLEVYRDTKSGEKTKRSWTEVWDAMACIALQKCAAEHNKPKRKDPEPVGQIVFNGWMPGGTTPSDPCDVVAVFDLGGRQIKRICFWTGECLVFERGGARIEMDVRKWMALPPDEEDEKC